MTTPPSGTPALTAESRDLIGWLETWTAARMGLAESRVLVDFLAAIEAAAVSRHVRETGCEGLREAARAVANSLTTSQGRTDADYPAALEALRKETNPVPATYVHRSGNESGCGACADSLLEGDTLDPNHPAAPSGKGDADGEWCWCGHYIEAAAVARAEPAPAVSPEACARERCGHAADEHVVEVGDREAHVMCIGGFDTCPCTGYLATGRED